MALYLRHVIHGDQILAEMERDVIDGDPHITDCTLSISLCPFHVHRELLVSVVAVGGQVVFTHARELVHVAIERLEVLTAPCAADAADMVANWEKYKSVENSLS